MILKLNPAKCQDTLGSQHGQSKAGHHLKVQRPNEKGQLWPHPRGGAGQTRPGLTFPSTIHGSPPTKRGPKARFAQCLLFGGGFPQPPAQLWQSCHSGAASLGQPMASQQQKEQGHTVASSPHAEQATTVGPSFFYAKSSQVLERPSAESGER